MTDLLSRPTRPDAAPRPGRPITVRAALGALAGAGTVLLACMALGLAGWFASDAGAHGDTRDALRVGADAWLLAHGSGLDLPDVTITAIPLGLTLCCLYAAYRAARWTASASTADPAEHPVDDRTLALTLAVFVGVYAAVATVTAVLAAVGTASPHLGRSFLGGLLVATAAGTPGLVVGSGRGSVLRERVPAWVRAVVLGGVADVLLLGAVAAALVTGALLMDLGGAANVLAGLHTGVAGGLLYTAVVAAMAPNAVLLGGAYLLGPGFAFGAGTVVSPSAVVLGPLPALPLLAALPDAGNTPAWASWLPGVPVLVGVTGAVLMVRRFPVRRLEVAAGRGLGAGLLGGILLGLVIGLAGGAIGPGRMAEVGAPLAEVLLASVVSMAAGGLVGAVVAAWWWRRRAASD